MLVGYPSHKTFVNCGISIMTEEWRKVSNKSIADNLLKSVGELLDAEVKYYYCSDRTKKHEKIVIEYNYEEK